MALLLLAVSCTSPDSANNQVQHQAAQLSEPQTELLPGIAQTFAALEAKTADIPEERKTALKKLALYVGNRARAGEASDLVFICTHNSRRSHMSQIWASTAAHHYGISNHVRTHSGGTEATAFNVRSVAALQRQGFDIRETGRFAEAPSNPIYEVTLADGIAFDCYSKVYDEPSNPSSDFAAVMTCSHADKNCPNIPGASLRVAVTYIDPKARDGQPDESQAYDERASQIATEMIFLMKQAALARG